VTMLRNIKVIKPCKGEIIDNKHDMNVVLIIICHMNFITSLQDFL